MALEPRKTCRACGASRLVPLFSLGEQCVSDFVESPDAQVLKYPIDIVQCTECTLLQQLYSAPQDFMYTRHYWYRSGQTETMRRSLDELAQELVGTYCLPGDKVLDIGSNDGTFLRAVTEYTGDMSCTVGVEPANNLVDIGRHGVGLLLNDFWSYGLLQKAGLDEEKFKVITALGMFYDLEDPNQFIRDVSLALHRDGVFVAQLMCAKNMYDMRDIGNLCHEHLEFYTLNSLRLLFSKYGMEIFDIQTNDVNGQSYRIFARHMRHRVSRRVIDAYASELPLHDPVTWRNWFKDLEVQKERCIGALVSCSNAFKKVYAYGASTKGNVILQWYDLGPHCLSGAVDKSVEKQGRFTVGTNLPIVSEEEARKHADYFLILPYAFTNEFLARESEWRERGGRFLVPLPEYREL